MIAAWAAMAASEPQCGAVPLPAMVEHYSTLILHQDSGQIAKLFGEDGEIDNPGAAPIRGEKAIAAMLGSFKGAVVNSEAMTVAEVAADGGGWRVNGRFHQTGRAPGGRDYDVTGSFDSTWVCARDGWQIRRMATGR